MRRLLLALVFPLVVGCAIVQMEKPGGTPQEAQLDGLQCRALAEQATPPGILLRGMTVESRVRECVIAKGYQEVTR